MCLAMEMAAGASRDPIPLTDNGWPFCLTLTVTAATLTGWLQQGKRGTEGAILQDSTATTRARHHRFPMFWHGINMGDAMDHQEPPVEKRSQRSEEPSRNSVTEPGPSIPRSHHNGDPWSCQSDQWGQLTGWVPPADDITSQQQHSPTYKINYSVPPHICKESYRYSNRGRL